MKINEKKELVKKIEKKVSQFKGIWFINFTGIDVKNTTIIRQELRKNLFEYKIVKNLILERVLKNLKIEPQKEWLDGPTAICIGNEIIAGTKILDKFQKELKKFKIKGGYFDGRILSLEDIEKITKIPDMKTLLTSVINSLFYPVNNFIWVSKNLLLRIVVILEEIRKKKGE